MNPNGYTPNGYSPNGNPHKDNTAIRPVRIETSTHFAPQLSNSLNPNYPQSAYQNSGQQHPSLTPHKPEAGVTGMLDQTASIELTQRAKYGFNPITGNKNFF
jgi:hypothetical protein